MKENLSLEISPDTSERKKLFVERGSNGKKEKWNCNRNPRFSLPLFPNSRDIRKGSFVKPDRWKQRCDERIRSIL